MSASAPLGLAAGTAEAFDRVVRRAADEGTPEVLDDAGAVLHPVAVQPAGTAVLGPRRGTTTKVGHPDGVGPGGVERRQERRWNWRA